MHVQNVLSSIIFDFYLKLLGFNVVWRQNIIVVFEISNGFIKISDTVVNSFDEIIISYLDFFKFLVLSLFTAVNYI